MNNFFKIRRQFKESNVQFQSDNVEALTAGIDAVRQNRFELERYILLHSDFVTSFQPVSVLENSPRVVRLMAEAASKANVGPMAAVAGALADLAVESILKVGASSGIVENGGEVSALTEEPFVVALVAGEGELGSNLGFNISPSDCPIGIATSSATISRAISFGEADAVTIFANSAALADAAATAVCNEVYGVNIEESVRRGILAAENLPFVRGALVVRGEYVGSTGWMPKFVEVRGDE